MELRAGRLEARSHGMALVGSAGSVGLSKTSGRMAPDAACLMPWLMAWLMVWLMAWLRGAVWPGLVAHCPSRVPPRPSIAIVRAQCKKNLVEGSENKENPALATLFLRC